MYEQFTDRARKVLRLANQEAQRFNHEYIATEHILLGLVKEGEGVASHTLKNLGLDLMKVRLGVEKIVQSGPDKVMMGKLPQTPRAKKVIEYALEEARNLNHKYVGTEHLLLGLLREEEGVAAQVLVNFGLSLYYVRKEVLNLLGHDLGAEKNDNVPAQEALPPDQERERIQRVEQLLGKICAQFESEREKRRTAHSLEHQLWNVRIVLGALVGAIAGVLLLAQFGAVMGLLLGGLVAALGWRTLGVLAGGTVGVFLGCTHLSNDGGGLAGALLGALVGFLIAEIGGTTGSRGFLGHWQKR